MAKKNSNKQAWLDWLADEAPTPSAQAELRERFKRQANSYQPVNRARPQQLPPEAPQPSLAAPQTVLQPQPVSHTTSAQRQAAGPSGASRASAPATVSIQIHLPSLKSKRFKQLAQFTKQVVSTVKLGLNSGKIWFLHQLATNKPRTLGISIGVPIIITLLLLPPLLHFGYGADEAASSGSSANGTSAGAKAGYDKPPFEVVTPSSKTKLATPDGVHAAYDGERNTYSYSDTINGSGFTVSQQPIPAQFKDGQAAVESIGPTLNKGVTPSTLNVITGFAAVSTNPKYNSQTVVANVRDLLIFITSSHAFKDSEWVSYLNSLQ